MLDYLGVTCAATQDYAINHAWNYVEINGLWYALDTTRAYLTSKTTIGVACAAYLTSLYPMEWTASPDGSQIIRVKSKVEDTKFFSDAALAYAGIKKSQCALTDIVDTVIPQAR
jgi:hypothetical protein